MWNRITNQGPLWFLYDPRARIKATDYRTDIMLVVFGLGTIAMIGFIIA